MVEESESESPSEAAADDESSERDPSDSGSDADEKTQIDPDTDRMYDPDGSDVDGSIEEFLDDGESVHPDEYAPAGDTGRDDPFDRDERRSVSEAVGAPIPDEELDDDPELDLEPAVDTDDADSVSDENTDAPDDSPETTDEDDDTAAETADEPAPPGSAPPSAEADAAATAQPEAESTASVDEGILGEGPASDEEMPLAAHIEEMVRRLAVVLVVGGVVALAVFPVADQLINFLWNSHIPGAETITDRRPRLYGPLELLVTELKVAALAGFVVGLPIAVYETYLFMRPGLFPRERRYYLAAVPTSLVLALIGVAFAHFVVLPAIFAYFTSYTTGTAVVAFGLKETFSLILVLMGYMALVFQIPLFIMLAIMMNLTTREWLEGRRLLFWGGFLGVAFLISPDPTGMAPIIVAATMIALFEGTLALLRWTGN
ncbi:twin-arginine translocase subunit TatC [Haloplanus halobius]|uniref:twin-arginine translocase subunit TatC n=1 Tax=Haloplanus halobius TaxID=2934938 RepID=UPI0024B219DD|nr:twin-arginine translocase subunit TatC [Haloplanus sp. XH21]